MATMGPGMGLRGRLALFFVVITVLPLAVAMAVLESQAARQRSVLAAQEMASARAAAVLATDSVRGRVGDAATQLAIAGAAALVGNDPQEAQSVVRRAARGSLAQRSDFLVLGSVGGDVVAFGEIEPAP